MSSRDNKGRFVKGQSGNPSGQPSRAAELRKLLADGADDAANKVLEAARNGDMAACRLVLERLVPAIKPTSEPVTFDLHGDSLTEQAQSVLSAVADGVLPPDQGKALIDAIGALVKVIDTDEVTRRLAALEEQKQ